MLQVYPEFDETPNIQLPEKYEWPNPDGLYCKSYCPLHPEVHAVVFDLADEICEVFETDAFHAGLDEVFYIGHKDCPRCYGHDKTELFAGEVIKIRDHLNKSGRELWMWRTAEIAIEQEKMMRNFIGTATPAMKPKYRGMLQTAWGSAESFMGSYKGTAAQEDKSAACFKALSAAWATDSALLGAEAIRSARENAGKPQM